MATVVKRESYTENGEAVPYVSPNRQIWLPDSPGQVSSAANLSKFFPSYQPRGVYYVCTIQMRGWILGGTPTNPTIIEGWIRKGMGVENEDEIRALAVQTLRDTGVDLSDEPTWDEITEASERVAREKQTNAFRRDEHGLYIESRCIKAMARENCNIVFASERWGPTKKGAKAYFVERVFIDPDRIYLDKTQPDGTHLFIGHVQGPQGRQSTLTYYEYVENARMTFQIRVFDDCIKPEQWGAIFESAQENGQGALRSQGFGRFDLVEWKGPFPIPTK